ncbi:Amuc_1101 family PilM-like pilus complex protein [Luteolibacter marinus]|uniref:Amuc_1101 family PilM-like pilus complex protein n=1 Tax=Luteolibacter marinus TaxID=2776705 RepID=UPI001865C8D8|nr:type IV pilus assembly protein PilM [Luteolibacter marinus]
MADTQSSIALNIGSQRVSMAVFEPSKSGGLVLKAYDSETILADPATEASRPSQIGLAISELSQRLKTGRSKVRYAISGQSVFTRFVKLPPLDDDNIEQLVTFEAQQHVPFPLEEVVWDYEVLEGAGEKEVVIVAIKGDALDELNESVTSTGLSTAEVDVAPMALYNAFRASYPGVTEPVLLIDIGAKTSDLLYIEGKRFFTRSVAMGGAAISTAIAKEYGVPFPEAEAHKTQGGMVALGGGHTEQMDETTAALAMTIRNTLGRLPAEIARTTNYYRSQHGGNAPKLVILAGGGANLPYTKEFFEEKLHLPVEFFNPVGAISVGKGVDSDKVGREAHLMGELIGLGLRGVGKSAINIDLVPTKVQATREADKKKPFYIGAAAVFLGGLALWGVMNTLAAGKGQDKLASLKEQQEELAAYAGPIKQEFAKQDKLVATATQYTNAEDDRTFWLDLLDELKAGFASDSVWISDFEPLYGYDALATGDAAKKVKPTVKNEFATATYGTTGLQNIQVDQKLDSRGRPVKPKPGDPEPIATANAVRIKGFWRENPRGSNLVYDLLKKLRENPQHFKFQAIATTEKGKKEEVTLKDQDIVKQLESAPAEESFASPFELVLPLSREVPVK